MEELSCHGRLHELTTLAKFLRGHRRTEQGQAVLAKPAVVWNGKEELV